MSSLMIDWETAHLPKKCLLYTSTCIFPYTILYLPIASKHACWSYKCTCILNIPLAFDYFSVSAVQRI